MDQSIGRPIDRARRSSEMKREETQRRPRFDLSASGGRSSSVQTRGGGRGRLLLLALDSQSRGLRARSNISARPFDPGRGDAPPSCPVAGSSRLWSGLGWCRSSSRKGPYVSRTTQSSLLPTHQHTPLRRRPRRRRVQLSQCGTDMLPLTSSKRPTSTPNRVGAYLQGSLDRQTQDR